MEFSTLKEYLAALRNDPTLAVIPASLVADHLEITPAAVSARVRAGHLQGVRIGRTPFIRIKSLFDEEERYKKQVAAVKTALEAYAKTGVSSIFYEPIMTPIGLSTTVPAHRQLIGRILGDISEETEADNKGMLTVLVHRNTQGKTRPGPGFFDLARKLGYEFSDENDFVTKQTKKVLSKYKPK
ncbi:hypothetical protein ACLBXM_18890 [Xanthobacteraceae bacterium A53D]